MIVQNAKKTRVIVVGGGIIGAFTAFYLSRQNARITIIDSFPRAFQGSTAAGFGSLTPYSDPYFRGSIGLFAASGVDLYKNDVVPFFSKSSLGGVFLSQSSLLQLFEDEHALKNELQKYPFLGDDPDSPSTARSEGLKFLSKAEALKLEPNLTDKFHSAIEFEEPWIDIEALLECLDAFLSANDECRRIFGKSVKRLEEKSDSVHVILSDGTVEEADWVVLATGMARLPILGIPTPHISLIRGDGAIALTPNRQPLVSRHVFMGKAFIAPRRDGRHLLGASYERVGNVSQSEPATNRETANLGSLAAILGSTQKLLPGLMESEVTRLWHGFRPATPKETPYIGPVPGHRHVLAALGFIGLGLTMAPAVGDALTRTIIGETNGIPDELSQPQPDLWGAT